MVLIIPRGDANKTHDYTLKGLMGICGCQRILYSLLRVPDTDKKMDLWCLHLNPHKITGFLVAESQIIDTHLSFPQILMESVAVVQASQ